MAVNYEVRDNIPWGVVILEDHAFDNSIIGITFDDRLVYCYELMMQELMNDWGWDELDAMDWLDYNTLRAIPYMGDKAPIVISEIIK